MIIIINNIYILFGNLKIIKIINLIENVEDQNAQISPKYFALNKIDVEIQLQYAKPKRLQILEKRNKVNINET